MIVPILKSQSDISTLASNLLDTASGRWTAAQYYQAINMALTGWDRRVRVPYVYSMPSGWDNSTYSYSLPSYIDGPIQPQGLFYTGDYPYAINISAENSTWRDMQAYDVEPNTSGGQTLRFHYYPYSLDGRIIWWGFNGPVPTTVAALSSGITSSDTSLTISSTPLVGRSGFVKIGGEWMQYAGVTNGTSTLTLTNLIRGLNGTTAASHNSSDSVYWGVAMDTENLTGQLVDATLSFLHQMKLINQNTAEAEHYEKGMLFYGQRATQFWRGYVPSRKPVIKLARQGIGVA